MHLLLTISLFIFFILVFFYFTFEKKIKNFIKNLKLRKFDLSLEDKIKLTIQDFYIKAEIIHQVGVTEIKVKRNRVKISVLHPCIAIGKKGCVIDDLKQTLKSYYGIEYIDLKEVLPFKLKYRKF